MFMFRHLTHYVIFSYPFKIKFLRRWTIMALTYFRLYIGSIYRYAYVNTLKYNLIIDYDVRQVL